MSFWSRPASPLAVMSIPCFQVHEYSEVVLYNKMAFEMHFHWAHGACVTTHVARMEGLVRCAGDASFVRRRGVLSSTRFTDAELVYFFRELGAHTVGARLPDEFGEMLDAVAYHRGAADQLVVRRVRPALLPVAVGGRLPVRGGRDIRCAIPAADVVYHAQLHQEY